MSAIVGEAGDVSRRRNPPPVFRIAHAVDRDRLLHVVAHEPGVVAQTLCHLRPGKPVTIVTVEEFSDRELQDDPAWCEGCVDRLVRFRRTGRLTEPPCGRGFQRPPADRVSPRAMHVVHVPRH